MSTARGRWVVAAVIVLGVIAGPASAQELPAVSVEAPTDATPPLDLVEAVRAALAVAPALASAEARVDAARADLSEAGATRWPSLAVTGSVQQFQEPMVATPIHGLTPGETPPFDETLIQGGLSLSYTLFDGGWRGARTAMAREGLSATRVSASATAQEVMMETASAFLEVQAQRSLVDAHVLRLEELRAELERVRRMREAGQIAPVDVLRVEAAVARGEADLVEVHARLAVSEADLGRLVGLPLDSVERHRLTSVRIPDNPLVPRDQLHAEARLSSPAVLAAERRAAAAEGAIRMAGSARWPRLETMAQYVGRGGADAEFSREWSAGIQLSLPVVTGGAVTARVARAEADHRAAVEEVRAARLKAEEAVDGAMASLTAATARVGSLRSVVDMAEEVVRVERLRVETGATTETDYLEAEADLLDARAALIRARTAEAGSWLGLARARGVLSVSWLAGSLGG